MQQAAQNGLNNVGNNIGYAEQGEPLNAQQVSSQQKRLQIMANHLIQDVELRKLALDQACKLAVTVGADDAVALAQKMHEFLTAGAMAVPTS